MRKHPSFYFSVRTESSPQALVHLQGGGQDLQDPLTLAQLCPQVVGQHQHTGVLVHALLLAVRHGCSHQLV